MPGKAADGGSEADSVATNMPTGQLAAATNQPGGVGEGADRGAEESALRCNANTHREPSPSCGGRGSVAQMAPVTPAKLESRTGVKRAGEQQVSSEKERVLAAVQQRR